MPIVRTLSHFLTRPSTTTLFILIVAATVRLWQLDYHSIWFDEAVTLKWATAEPAYTWRVTFQLVEDKHPPLYYIGLHYWMQLLSPIGLAQNDAALRAFGALLGTFTTWIIYRMACQIGSRSTAALAALLVAIAPVLVWYSQELRMFQPATTAIVLAAFALWKAWHAQKTVRRILWWVLLVASLDAAAYSYLFSAFAFPTAGIALLALALPLRRWSRFGEGALALAIAGTIFLPLARNAWRVNADEGDAGAAFQNFGPNLQHLLQVFTIWRVEWPQAQQIAALLLLALLLAAGLLLSIRKNGSEQNERGNERLWLAIWVGVPLLIANLLLSRSASIFDEDRYLLFLAPFCLWAIARGAVALYSRLRPLGWAAGAAAFLILALALPQVWTPRLMRENWRAAARTIWEHQQASPGQPAAVVAHVDYTRLGLEWYLRQVATFEELPIFFPFGGRLTPEQAESDVAPPLLGIVDLGAQTLWLTQSHLDGVDDQRVVENWLAQNYPLVTEQYPAGIKLTGYMLHHRYTQLPQLAATAIYPHAELVPGMVLEACELMTPGLSARDEESHPPSGWVHVRLWWKSTAPIEQDYIATAQMVGPEGVWGDRLYRANEALRRTPPTTWQPGEIIRDEIDINLNPVTPGGFYPILIGVMDAAGQPTGNRAECGQVEIYR